MLIFEREHQTFMSGSILLNGERIGFFHPVVNPAAPLGGSLGILVTLQNFQETKFFVPRQHDPRSSMSSDEATALAAIDQVATDFAQARKGLISPMHQQGIFDDTLTTMGFSVLMGSGYRYATMVQKGEEDSGAAMKRAADWLYDAWDRF